MQEILSPFSVEILRISESSSRLVQMLNIAVTGIICGGVYLVLNRKALGTVLPEKLAKKLHLN
jgi:hypothetical protein